MSSSQSVAASQSQSQSQPQNHAPEILKFLSSLRIRLSQASTLMKDVHKADHDLILAKVMQALARSCADGVMAGVSGSMGPAVLAATAAKAGKLLLASLVHDGFDGTIACGTFCEASMAHLPRRSCSQNA